MNLLVHNVIEREIEREKVQMKPPSVKGRFGVATWKAAAFCDCGAAKRGVARRGDTRRGASAESLQMTRPPMYNDVSDTHHEKKMGKIFV